MEESYDKSIQCTKKQSITLPTKICIITAMVFPVICVSWVLKNWCFWIVVLEKTLESPWDRKEIKSMNPIGNQFWIFIRSTVAQAEATNTFATGAKSQLIGKDLDTGKDGGLEEKGVTQDQMVGWHHWLKGHEFEQTLGESEGQGSSACYSPWCHRVGHNLATEQQWAIGLCLKWATLS